MSGSSFVSVVTPVYNGERFLDEGIESIRAQTLTNFEYVILDNASTDGTAAIIERHAAADPRIRVHRNDQTVPVIDNWNRAVELISPDSRYCRVIHADDTVPPDALEKTVGLAERHPSVGIVGSLRQRGESIQCEGLPRDRQVFSGREIGRLFFREEVFGMAPTSNLLRADLVRGRRPFYPAAYLHADLAVYFDLLPDCDFGFVHEVLAFSREHEASITTTVAQRRQTLLKEWLLLLQRFGPRYFSEDELADMERAYLRRYYRNLVRGAVKPGRREFLDYHLAGLREADRMPGPADWMGAVGRELMAALAHPSKLRRHLRP